MPKNALTLLDVIILTKSQTKPLSSYLKRLNLELTKNNIAYKAIILDESRDGSLRQTVRVLSKYYPLEYKKKRSQSGKTFSVLEALVLSFSPYIAVLDIDSDYPPEIMSEMFELTQLYGLVLASELRVEKKPGSFSYKKIRLSGTIEPFVVKSDILRQIEAVDITKFNLLTPLIRTSLEMGFTVGQTKALINRHSYRKSKIKLLSLFREFGNQFVKFNLTSQKPLKIDPGDVNSMTGAGVIHHRAKFITHTTLEHKYSAVHTLVLWQKIALLSIIALILGFLAISPLNTLIALTAILTFAYFIDLTFNLILILRSLHFPPEIEISSQKINTLRDKELPVYTILCPMYREAKVLPDLLNSISKIDWPKDKLDVILLLEKDDKETVQTAYELDLPPYIRILIVPESQPKTKPKACNYGLNHAKGDFLVIYDAEDSPDPLQLKKVYLAFKQVSSDVKCIQAKLNYYNSNQNLLTRLFTAEYSLWFDVILTGLQTVNTVIPLGGTSNHFRTKDLLELEGWDPFNVTEDADLGIRLFKRGAKTAIVDSVTFEEANSNPKNWLRQRSRWVKGYIQTYLVHLRDPISFFRRHGWHTVLFHLSIGGKIAFMLINPFMWLTTISYFALNSLVGPTIESLYPPVIFYMAAASFVFGNFLFLYYYMIGLAKRKYWWLMKYVFLVPFYWLMASVAAGIAFYQLIVKPHYWEKTIHGLHLKDSPKKEKQKLNILIFNWRDIRHIWSGGAEVYVHEIAKRLVSLGHNVTLFCSNDRRSPSQEYIDGVKVVRKGGFYTVYLWAFIKYFFSFRKKTDVIIDSINGVPFFSPLFSRKPKIGLLYHIHQNVFRQNLSAPMASLACFLEGKLMPKVYKNTQMVTISPSSKIDMEKLGFGTSFPIEIINPGVEDSKFHPQKKTINPSILYLGRLKAYKSIDTLIRAMKLVVQKNPQATLKIAGFGESREYLEQLVKDLRLDKFVQFLGKVSEEAKVKLLSQSWIFVQPSSMEGWGISAIEANASGTPVIASDVPGLRDSVQNPHTGFLVTKGNAPEFAKKINLLINNEKLRHKLEKGSLKWSKNFSWSKSTDQFLKIIESSYGK
ncbi:MAG: glycosyltransferase [Patescibacteria group bacterium]|jgi:glycosyltransferase involved in cell wall biosynthesis/cellulose synthase/poly-beta-1,6-N-acetylglucosamine synthase-like glycosyltransferase